MSAPDITYIVSTHHRPRHLAGLLRSLQVQTHTNFECVITDNSTEENFQSLNWCMLKDMEDAGETRFRLLRSQLANCYDSAELAAKDAQAPLLCFPSDDNYYVPMFGEIMLATQRSTQAPLVYCDFLYDPRLLGFYGVVDAAPMIGRIDKGGFLVDRKLFLEVGWPRPMQYGIEDGLFIRELMKRNVAHAKAPGVLWVHN